MNEALEPPSEYLANWVLSLGIATGHADTTEDLLSDTGEQIKDVFGKYFELLNLISKHPGESLHETALRYIQESNYEEYK